MMKKWIVALALVLSIFTLQSAHAEMVFLQGNGSEPQTLDPQIITGQVEMHIVMGILEGLISYDPKTLDPVPGIAETWENTPDGLTYTFHLRKNAKWTNGDPVTAHDFVYSWNRYLAPELASEYAYMLSPIKNAEAYNQGKIKDFSEVGVKATDDYTLVVTLEKPCPYFIGIVQFPGTYPVHKPTIEKFGGMTARNSEWVRPENFVGNGPFVLKSWVLNDKVVIEKNPSYWDKDNVKLDKVELYAVDNILTEEKMFRSGMLDKTYEFPTEKIATYRQESPEKLMFSPYLATYYYILNVKVPPLDNKLVRQALFYAIDRETITKYVLKGEEKPAYTLIPEGTGGFKSKLSVTFDIAKARDLLAKAGYPNGAGFPKLQLLYNTNENHRKIAETVQQMWKKNLGVDIELVNQDWKVYLDTLANKNFQISRRGWIGDYNDPNTFLSQFFSTSGTNDGNYNNPEFDKWVLAQQDTLDPALRTQAFDEAEKILLEDVPLVPIYHYVKTTAISPKVKGWYSNLLDLHPLKNVYMEP